MSGVSGWGAMSPKPNGPICMTVRLIYDDATTEDIPLMDGVHFADYIGPHDVPESKLAFRLRGQQLRYFSLTPKRTDAVIKQIELVKGPHNSSPVVMAITVEP